MDSQPNFQKVMGKPFRLEALSPLKLDSASKISLSEKGASRALASSCLVSQTQDCQNQAADCHYLSAKASYPLFDVPFIC